MFPFVLIILFVRQCTVTLRTIRGSHTTVCEGAGYVEVDDVEKSKEVKLAEFRLFSVLRCLLPHGQIFSNSTFAEREQNGSTERKTPDAPHRQEQRQLKHVTWHTVRASRLSRLVGCKAVSFSLALRETPAERSIDRCQDCVTSRSDG